MPILASGFLMILLLGLNWLPPWRRKTTSSKPDSATLASLAEMGEAITSASSDPNDLAELAYQETARNLDTDFFQLGVFEGDNFRTLIQVRDGKRLENVRVPIHLTELNIIHQVRDHHKPLLLKDAEPQTNGYLETLGYESTALPHSWLFVPLKVSDQMIGIIGVQSRQSGAYQNQHRQLLCILANHVAASLALVSLHAEIEYRSIRLSTVGEISRRLITMHPLPALFDEVAHLVSEAFENCIVGVYEIDKGGLALRASAPDHVALAPALTLQTEGIVGRALSESRPLIQWDHQQDIMPPGPGSLEGAIEIAVPLQVEEQTLGALYIRSIEGSSFAPDHFQLAEMLAAQLALAIFEAHNFAQRQEENWITTILLEVAQHASQPGDVDQALQSVLQLTTLVAGTSWAILLVNEEGGQGLRVGPVAGLRRKQQLGIREFTIHPSSINLQPPYRESDLPFLIELPEYLAGALNTKQANALILSDGATLLGVLLLEDIELSERRNSLLAGIARQVSLRIENSRLVDEIAARRSLQHEIAMARNIQQSFLPKYVPIYPGWEIGVTWQMARDVGGDFYDFIPLPPGPDGPRLGIVIADVAGKGVPAALFMAMCRTLLRSVAIRRIEPGITLERLNEILFNDTETDLFISLFYALWEPEANKLTYANAGHNPPLLFTPEQPAQVVGEHGMVLNVDHTATYETYRLDCSPDSMLVMYTDGVTEAMTSSGELFDLHRLEHLVLGMKDWKAQGVADRIAERVKLFTAEPDLSDDLTAIVLRRTGAVEI